MWERYLADRRALPPGAEPQASVVDRITAALTEIATADAPAPFGSAVLVVSHGGTIRSFIHHATGLVPAPLENGAMFRIHFQRGVAISVAPHRRDSAAVGVASSIRAAYCPSAGGDDMSDRNGKKQGQKKGQKTGESPGCTARSGARRGGKAQPGSRHPTPHRALR